MSPNESSGSQHDESIHTWATALSAVAQATQAFTMVQPLMFDITAAIYDWATSKFIGKRCWSNEGATTPFLVIP